MPKKSTTRLTKKFVDALGCTRDVVFWDSQTKGFGVRVKPGGQKTYLIQYRNADGVSRRLTLGKHGDITAAQAEDLAKAKLGQVAIGNDPAEAKAEARKAITVKQLCEDYLAAAERGSILGKRGLPKKPGTLYVDRGRINRHILPQLGNRRVRDLTTPDINRFMRDVEAGKTATDVKTKLRGRAIVEGGRGTASRTVGLFGGILSYAVSEGIIAVNPCRGVKRPADGKRKVRLTSDQYRALGDALRLATEDGEPWQATEAIWTLALTGCRLSEVSELHPHEVDVVGSALRLHDSKEGESIRPLGAAAIQNLKTRLGNSNYVYPSPRNQDNPYGGLPGAWKRIFARIDSKVVMPKLTIHGLRHAFASIAGDLGYSNPTIKMLIGHASSSDSTEGYIHALDSALISAADNVSATIAKYMAAEVRVEL